MEVVGAAPNFTYRSKSAVDGPNISTFRLVFPDGTLTVKYSLSPAAVRVLVPALPSKVKAVVPEPSEFVVNTLSLLVAVFPLASADLTLK